MKRSTALKKLIYLMEKSSPEAFSKSQFPINYDKAKEIVEKRKIQREEYRKVLLRVKQVVEGM